MKELIMFSLLVYLLGHDHHFLLTHTNFEILSSLLRSKPACARLNFILCALSTCTFKKIKYRTGSAHFLVSYRRTLAFSVVRTGLLPILNRPGDVLSSCCVEVLVVSFAHEEGSRTF